ncbi:ABC transporter [Paenibacillus sp. FSL R7-0273]|uniref:ABC transporter ATP-binding protein n=1 Tax=Paenibacillus sp. FSL R7-0273 TaxID=1536772 RepID=UPI0004F5F7F2|nr:ABC transporter ATP-binding protein [Paenibacillus sp. FSL R7-0273]AIQ45505.1 ABC transporter [Paenibacillus sp. FSL R7-0273]OMF89120.1 ABC transporter [Paenibacillus sp. FSL R7-0273]
MENGAVLSVTGLSKQYGALLAVDNISFTVRKGEVFGLLGPNGAGKTTTIRMLCGLLKADAGRIHINGIPMTSGCYERIKPMIGLCPQDIVIWELLTCLEQLRFAGISYGLTFRAAGNRAESLLHALGLWDKRNKLARTLSGGMQRRLNIALALVHDPELIILDEPQAGLDPQSRILVRDFIRGLARDKTVILTTHDMDEADRLSDRIAIMDHGTILLLDTPARLKAITGTGELLQVRVTGISRELAEKVLRTLPPECTEKTYTDGLLLLGGGNVLEGIPEVQQRLRAQGLHIEDITLRKRTLEDAFIALTGRGLRE